MINRKTINQNAKWDEAENKKLSVQWHTCTWREWRKPSNLSICAKRSIHLAAASCYLLHLVACKANISYTSSQIEMRHDALSAVELGWVVLSWAPTIQRQPNQQRSVIDGLPSALHTYAYIHTHIAKETQIMLPASEFVVFGKSRERVK